MIRFAEPADAPKVAEMCAKFYDMALSDMLGEYDQRAAQNLVVATAMASDACTIVAEVDGNMVGVMCVISNRHILNPSALIASELFWWVEPEHRKSGLGKDMLAKAEDWAKELGCRGMVMVTMHGIDHERNGAFYERSGYSPLEHSYFKRV